MKKHEVGQVLFILAAKDMRIHPVMVVEEVTKKTLSGEQTNYTVESSTARGRKRFDLNLDGLKVFDTIDEIKTYLLENAKNAIEEMCNSASTLAEKEFETITSISFEEKVEEKNASLDLIQKSGVKETHTVILSNGEEVKMQIPGDLH